MGLSDSVVKILLSQSQIQERVHQLAHQISEEYTNCDLVLVCVLKGAIRFFGDLMRALSVPVRHDFVALTSYYDTTKSSDIRMLQELNCDVSQADLLIVEDIVDTGKTLDFLMNHIKARNPASVKVCSLLDKPGRREVPVTIDYLGFEIPDIFVVGYGMDYAERYRDLPYVGILDES